MRKKLAGLYTKLPTPKQAGLYVKLRKKGFSAKLASDLMLKPALAKKVMRRRN